MRISDWSADVCSSDLGNSASGSFSKGAIAVGATMLAAGGSTGMSVDIVDKEGNLAPGTSASILFSSSCLASGTATITPESPSLTTGRANVTYKIGRADSRERVCQYV